MNKTSVLLVKKLIKENKSTGNHYQNNLISRLFRFSFHGTTLPGEGKEESLPWVQG